MAQGVIIGGHLCFVVPIYEQGFFPPLFLPKTFSLISLSHQHEDAGFPKSFLRLLLSRAPSPDCFALAGVQIEIGDCKWLSAWLPDSPNCPQPPRPTDHLGDQDETPATRGSRQPPKLK